MRYFRNQSEADVRQMLRIVLGGAVITLTSAAVAGEISGQMSVGLVITGGATATPQTALATAVQPSHTYTPGAAAITVRRAGYSDVSLYNNSGGLFVFKASRTGNIYYIGVSVSSGKITSVSAL